MIDTHCHLLPAIDDGPRSERDAVDLARALAAQGVSRVLCTPHYSSMFPTVHADAELRFAGLRRALEAEGIPLELQLAAELGPAAAASEPLDELLPRTVGGRWAVVEVLPDTPPSALASIFERLSQAGLGTVFAHPERARAVQRSPGVLDPLRKDGALLQVVAPSLVGRWGRDADGAGWRLLDTGRVDLLGSDAHGVSRRRPHLREARDLIAERLGDAVAEELTVTTPRRVLDGDPGQE